MPYCGRCGIRYDAENPRTGPPLTAHVVAHCRWCQEELQLTPEQLAAYRTEGTIISAEILESDL